MINKRYKPHALISSPLYHMTSKKKLAEALYTTPEAMKITLEKDDLYKRKWKHKKNKNMQLLSVEPTPKDANNYRSIDIPDFTLKQYQSRIAYLLGKIIPPDYLFSPVKGRSYVDNAVHHIQSNAFWMLDIANYFPSCSANNVAWFFRKILGCSPDVTALLVKITTYNQSLPQGSPCSPILAFYSNMGMWEDIRKLATSYGCIISVYVDDITISSKTYVPKELIWKIKQRVARQRLVIKREKEANVFNRPASITGVIINDNRSLLPNRHHKQLNILQREYASTTNTKKRKKMKNQIAGRLAQKGQIEDLNIEHTESK